MKEKVGHTLNPRYSLLFGQMMDLLNFNFNETVDHLFNYNLFNIYLETYYFYDQLLNCILIIKTQNLLH